MRAPGKSGPLVPDDRHQLIVVDLHNGGDQQFGIFFISMDDCIGERLAQGEENQEQVGDILSFVQKPLEQVAGLIYLAKFRGKGNLDAVNGLFLNLHRYASTARSSTSSRLFAPLDILSRI